MGKIFLLCALTLFAIMLTGCSDERHGLSEPTAEAVSPEPEAPAPRSRLALDRLEHNVSRNRPPDNFAGAYIKGETLVIMLTDDDRERYGFMSKYEYCVEYRLAEHSLKELNELFDGGTLYDLLDEQGIEMVYSYVDEESNSVRIAVLDEYTDEEKEDILAFFEEYPVTIEFSKSRIILL